MTTVQTFRGKKILIFVSIIVILLFLVNLILTYLTNLFITSFILPEVNNSQRNLVFNTSIQLFPSTKLNIKELEYTQENKSILTIKELSANLSFWELFKRKLHVKKLSINGGTINLYNIPSISWKKSTKTTTKEKKVQEESKEVEKTLSQTSQEDSFFRLDNIELTNLQINYSTSPESQPIYLNTITYDNSQSPDANHILNITGSWWNESLNATLAANFLPGNQMIKANIVFANNELLLTAQPIEHSFQIQTHIVIKNQDILEQLLSIPKSQLPTQIDARVNLANNKLSISPLQIVFPDSVFNADISKTGSSPFIIQITVPENLLIILSGNTLYQNCPLPEIAKLFIKGINTQVTVTMPESPQIQNSQTKKAFITIDGLGIQFKGETLPYVLQKNLQTCFDYKLQDGTTETTYSIN